MRAPTPFFLMRAVEEAPRATAERSVLAEVRRYAAEALGKLGELAGPHAGALAAVGARDIRRLARGRGAAYAERRRRHRLAVAAAVRSGAFLSNLEEGLAGATSALAAAAKGLDALAGDGEGTSAARAPKRRRR